MEKNLQHIFKIVIEIQVSILAPIIFLKGLQNHLANAYFLDIYYRKNYLVCYNFCQ